MASQSHFRPAPRFDDEELNHHRMIALNHFVEGRQGEGDGSYRTIYNEARPSVARLFECTNYLRAMDSRVFSDEPSLLGYARFLASPPISADDLNSLVGQSVATRKTLPDHLAQDAIDVLEAMVDLIRFPWLAKHRQPTRHELETAINWTTGLFAIERLRTNRRTESAKRQEDAVADLFLSGGWLEAKRQPIQALDDLPRGYFCREVEVWGTKCDLPIRLRDGRLLTLECKVSNSATNSVKRLIRETCGKAKGWRDNYGQLVLTGAVLDGVFKLKNLKEAQDDFGVAIFWEHDLQPLLDFIKP